MDVAVMRLSARTVVPYALLALTGTGNAQAKTADLADLSLEELANIEITSVSRRAERLADAPASIYVITGEDIRRSGATSLPEVLRLAPNLQVARIDSRQYAITARGFNGTAASNKLLVLIDGRTVYTPLFSGVFWDVQDTLLEDIERIEVISGPGATLWGANAVNGVINVITRSAADTRGTLAYAGAGNVERGAAARHGVELSGGGALRVYGKFFDRDNTERSNGTLVADAWHHGQGGFRADWRAAADSFTFQGDAYRGRQEQAAPGETETSGGNLLARWARRLSGIDRLQVQVYFDNTEREIPGSFVERLNTYDIEAQHGFQAARAHYLTWGGGYRQTNDRVTNTPALAFLPADKTLRWTSLFAQDEIDLSNTLRLTVGAKLESNSYTGSEFLPSARLAWKHAADDLLWAAASRAVRAPSRIDRELFSPSQPPFLLAGGPDFRSEISNIFELGYRAQVGPRASYSATAFHSVHDHLRSIEPAGGGALVFGNKMEGKSTGLEAWGSVQATARWRLSAGATLLDQDLRLKADSGDPSGVAAAGNDPSHQLSLRSSHDLPRRQRIDVTLRQVGRLPSPAVPEYTSLDVHYSWRWQRGIELSLAAQNLGDPRHPEFGAAATRSEIERALLFALRWTP
jgi:iron complex outermembrane receptor protein